MPASDPDDLSLRDLLAAIDAYLVRLQGPGIGEVRRLATAALAGESGPIAPRSLPVLDQLGPALDGVRREGEPTLADAIARVAPSLAWTTYDAYPRHEIGERFADGHAFATLIGPEGPIRAEDFDLGLFLIAPRILYRDHHHAAPELYAPLTGPHCWRFRPGDPFAPLPPHLPVWNEPWRPHATLVGEVPFFCLYAWTRDIAMPARVLQAGDWADLEGRPSATKV